MKIILFFYLSVFSMLLSDTMTMKNGEKINGNFLEQSPKFIIFKKDSGEILSINRSEVQNLIFNETGRPLNVTEEANRGISDSYPSTEGGNPVTISISHEFVSDFIWRGNSYGGNYMSRRNNEKYKETTEYYAYQPNLRVQSPSGLYFELWGNMALKSRSDKDSDLRALQAYPGGPAIDPDYYFKRIESGNLSDGSTSIFYDPGKNVYSATCGDQSVPTDCLVNPSHLRNHKEKNGMWRTDGMFTTFGYEMPGGKFGNFTFGTWWYFESDKNSRYSWNEYFIWWSLPILQDILSPQLQFYTQSSQDGNAGADGGNYIALTASHTFFEGNFFQIVPSTNVGYKSPNNNTDRKSGFNDITTSLKFLFGDFFFSLNHAHRPDIALHDNDSSFYTSIENSNAYSNLSSYDGKTVDPSKLFGFKNELVYNTISELNIDSLYKEYLARSYQYQKIPRNLFWISVGFNQSF